MHLFRFIALIVADFLGYAAWKFREERGSISFDQATARAFHATLSTLYQQEKSLLENQLTSVHRGVKGEKDSFDRLGPVIATDIADRHGDTQYLNPKHSKRWDILVPSEAAVLLDKEDEIRALINPTSEYTKTIAAALGRRADKHVINAAVGDIKAGQWIPLIYDGTNFEIFNGIPNNAAAGGGGVIVLDQTATDVTVGNTTTETTVYSKSIPGGTLGTVGKLRLTIHWRQKNHAGGDGISLTVRYKFGATTLITENTGDINMTAFGDQTSIFELMADTATNTQLAKSLHIGINNGVASLFTARGPASEDSTAAKTLAVTFQWSAAGGANQSAVMEHATLEQVK
jgi:hypothetical protein